MSLSKRSHEDAFGAAAIPEKEEESTSGNENHGGNNELVERCPKILGLQYEGEEVKLCPRCDDNLLWYSLPNDKEMLACCNPACEYPFDVDIEDYEIRNRTHGKQSIGKELAAASADSSTDSSLPALAWQQGKEEDQENDQRKSLIPYGNDKSKKSRKSLQDHLHTYVNTPPDQRHLLFPNVNEFQITDTNALGVVVNCLEESERVDETGGVD